MAEDLIAPTPRVTHPAAQRFRILKASMVALAIVLLVAGGAILGSSDSRSGPAPGWSEWQPGSSGTAAAQEIADHVGPQYRGADGKQLVAVSGGELKVANLPVRIAIRGADSSGSIQMVGGSGFLYTLCGLGPNCSIESGKPSVARMLLLRREALELALYSFRAEPDLENVVVLLPPRPGSRSVKLDDGTVAQVGNQGTGLLFRRTQLGPELSARLVDTIPQRTPNVATMANSPEAPLVTRITEPSMFLVSIKQGQDASAYLVLDPIR